MTRKVQLRRFGLGGPFMCTILLLQDREDFPNGSGARARNLLACVASVEGNLWMVNPDWSHIDKSWVDADPHHWGSQPGAESTHKPGGVAPAPKVSPTH